MSPESMGNLDFDPSDPLQVAVKITRMEGALLRSQEAFTETAGNLDRGISGLRADFRGIADQLKDLPRLATNQDNQNSGLGRAFHAIEELARQTREGFESRDKEGEDWRTRHEDDNRKTREKLILWNGMGVGFSMLAMMLVGVLLYIYTEDKTASRETAERLERQHAADTARLEAAINTRAGTNSAAIREIERYLTQEGTVSGRPYVPSRTQ